MGEFKYKRGETYEGKGTLERDSIVVGVLVCIMIDWVLFVAPQVCREQFVALHSQPILEELSGFLLKKYCSRPP